MWAGDEGHANVIRVLVEAGGDVKSRTDLGFTALLFAVRDGRADAVRALLDSGADANDQIRPTRKPTADRQEQAVGAGGIDRVRVEAPPQQGLDGARVILRDGPEEVLVGTRLGAGKCKRQKELKQIPHLDSHVRTPLTRRSKLALVTAATASTAGPRREASCAAT